MGHYHKIDSNGTKSIFPYFLPFCLRTNFFPHEANFQSSSTNFQIKALIVKMTR